MAKNQEAKEWLVCIAKNMKNGITKNDNPWRSVGLVVQEGPRKGEWVNYFKVITERTLPYWKKDCFAMGITNDSAENFQCDGRRVTVKWGEDDYMGKKEDRPLGVLPYDASKYKAPAVAPAAEDDLPF